MTERRKLTDAFAKKHFESKNTHTVWDTIRSGFGLKIHSRGNVDWIVKYRVGTGRSGRRREYKIGPPHLYSCGEARILADDFIVAGRRGEDYRETLEAYHSKQIETAHTRVLEEYGVADSNDPSFLKTAWMRAIILNTDVSKRHARSRERLWKHISERFGETIRTTEFDASKIALIKSEMHDRPAEFNKFRAVLQTVLKYEFEEGRLQKNPLSRIKPYSAEFRDTILSEKGVSDFVKYFGELSNFESNYYNHARFVLCLLKTGVRPAMLRTLLAEDDGDGNFVDLNTGVMIFRTHKTSKKSTAKAAEISISDEAIKIMQAAREETPHSLYVFGSHDQRRHFKDLPLSEKRLQTFFRYHVDKEDFETEGTEKLVLYSLRHTFGSALVNKGVSLVHVSRMMLHKNISTTQRYIKDTLETRRAVAQRVDEIIK